MVIDRRARDRASQLLRDFISGKITNFDFESRWPVTQDPSVDAIWDTAWLFYDDFKTHKLTGRHKLDATTKRMIVRWIIFLHGDFDYQWPRLSLAGADPSVRVEQSAWQQLFFPSGLKRTKVNEFLKAGHYPVWPFGSVKDYKAALSKPRFLSRAK